MPGVILLFILTPIISMKAITPVIALTMLVLITVGIIGIAYAWFSGVLSGTSEKAISIPNGGAYCIGTGVFVIILNIGATSSIANADIKILQVDAVDLPASLPSPIAPGQAKVVISNYQCGGSCAGAGHDIRVGTSTNIVQSRVICK